MTTTSTSRRSSSDARLSRRARTVALDTASGRVHVVASSRPDGDFHPGRTGGDELAARRAALVDLPWTMLDQRHGTEVVRVVTAGGADGSIGDIAITDRDGAVLGCWVADCAPLVLASDAGEVAIVHAGWRGLAAGVIDVALGAFGDRASHAVLGPTIGACCYEFGAPELAEVADGVGAPPVALAARTSSGAAALDVARAVEIACARAGLSLVRLGGCTGCGFDGFSHRVRREPERHVVAAWREAT